MTNSGPNSDIEIRERLIRIETLLETSLKTCQQEVPKLSARVSLLEQWRAKSMGVVAAVGAVVSAIVSYAIKHGAPH